MEKININGKEFSLSELNELIENAKKQNPMDEVYTYHNTTEGAFEELYKNVSEFAKFQEVERMIVNFYNKGVKCDWDNTNQRKYYPYFYLGKNFAYDDCINYHAFSGVSTRLCFLRAEDLKEAVVKFKEQYKNSRNL